MWRHNGDLRSKNVFGRKIRRNSHFVGIRQFARRRSFCHPICNCLYRSYRRHTMQETKKNIQNKFVSNLFWTVTTFPSLQHGTVNKDRVSLWGTGLGWAHSHDLIWCPLDLFWHYDIETALQKELPAAQFPCLRWRRQWLRHGHDM